GSQLEVAPEVHGTGVEEGAHAVLPQLLHAGGAARDTLAGRRPVLARVRVPARPADEEVLVHERQAELVGGTGAADRLHASHATEKSARPRTSQQPALTFAEALPRLPASCARPSSSRPSPPRRWRRCSSRRRPRPPAPPP